MWRGEGCNWIVTKCALRATGWSGDVGGGGQGKLQRVVSGNIFLSFYCMYLGTYTFLECHIRNMFT